MVVFSSGTSIRYGYIGLSILFKLKILICQCIYVKGSISSTTSMYKKHIKVVNL